MYDNLTSSLFQEALQPLQVTLYFEDILNDVYDSQECWVDILKCICCKKHVFVKKPSSEFVNLFMSKVVMSVWFVHVFALKEIPENEWYEVNKNWNICLARKGVLFNKLKVSFYKDVLDNVFHKDSPVLCRSVLNLESLWDALYSNFYSLYEVVAKIGNIMTFRMEGNIERRYPGRTFAQRSQELLQEIAPSTNRGNLNDNERYKRQQSILNRQKRKRERSINCD